MKSICLTKDVSLPSKKGMSSSTTLLFIFRSSLFLSLFFLLAAVAFASPFHKKTDGDNNKTTLDWKADATINNVSFYHAISECNGKKVVFLKFVNKNNYATTVSWKETVKTQMRDAENAFRGEQHLTLPPGETMEQDCSGASCKACVLSPDKVNPTYMAQILDYSFKDITVTR